VGVAAGGLILAKSIEAAIEANGTAKADMEIHTRSLEELGQSLATEVTPVVIEVEGSTVELKGSADAKFSQWRKIMKKLHEREVGPIDDTTPVAVPLSSRGPSS
jgi:biopolymer transport protein ExbD